LSLKQLFCVIITLFRWHLITEYKHLSRDPQLSSVTRNCQIYIIQFDTLKTGIFKSEEFMNGIIIRKNYLLNNMCSFNSSYVRFKEKRFVNFFTDLELSSSLYFKRKNAAHNTMSRVSRCHDKMAHPQTLWAQQETSRTCRYDHKHNI